METQVSYVSIMEKYALAMFMQAMKNYKINSRQNDKTKHRIHNCSYGCKAPS